MGVLDLRDASTRSDQAWFWTSEWQAMEREADEDLDAGRYEDYETLDDFIEDLDAFAEERTSDRA